NFAAQAVIAIENARLLNELRQSLEQQTATAEILGAISSSPGRLEPVFDAILENAVRLGQADMGHIYRWATDGFHVTAMPGAPAAYEELVRKRMPWRPGAHAASVQAMERKEPVQVADMKETYGYSARETATVAAVEIGGIRTILCVPMLRENEAIGVIILCRREVRRFSQNHIDLVVNFAKQAVIAIENTRLFEAEQQRTHELRESLEQQTATSEVLRVISSSPGDLKPVFNAMLENAVRLCEAEFGHLFLYDGEAFHAAALHSASQAYAEVRRRPLVLRELHADNPLAVMTRTKAVVHTADVRTEKSYIERDPTFSEFVDVSGARALLLVPMLKENELIGAFTIYRLEVRPFTDKQIALVQNFAAQAVIAIENTRLLNELRESLKQQTATANVLKVISRSTFDLRTVLNTLTKYAVELCAADRGVILMQDGDVYRVRAIYGFPRETEQYALENPLRLSRGNMTGRVAVVAKAVHSPDGLPDHEYTTTAYQKAFGYRTNLGVPLLREGTTIGVFSLTRDKVNPFTDKQIELASTFADQAVIA